MATYPIPIAEHPILSRYPVPFKTWQPDPAKRRYVSPAGDDAADGLTESTSWRTLAVGVSRLTQPGMHIHAKTGTYVEGPIRLPDGVGTPDEPLAIIAIDGPGSVFIDSTAWTSGPNKSAVSTWDNNFLLRGLKVKGGYRAFQFGGDATLAVLITECEGLDAMEDIAKGSQCRGPWLVNNDFHGCFEEPADFVAVIGGGIIHNRLHRWVSAGVGDVPGAAGFMKGGSRDILVEYNDIFDYVPTVTPATGDGFVLGGYSTGKSNVWLEGLGTFEAANITFRRNRIGANVKRRPLSCMACIDSLIEENLFLVRAAEPYVLSFEKGEQRLLDANNQQIAHYKIGSKRIVARANYTDRVDPQVLLQTGYNEAIQVSDWRLAADFPYADQVGCNFLAGVVTEPTLEARVAAIEMRIVELTTALDSLGVRVDGIQQAHDALAAGHDDLVAKHNAAVTLLVDVRTRVATAAAALVG